MERHNSSQVDCVHKVLYMVPSTKYQYEKDCDKVLSVEYDDALFTSHQVSLSTHRYPNATSNNYHHGCCCSMNCRGAFFHTVTPELTDSSSSNSLPHPIPVQLVDSPMKETVFADETVTVKNKVSKRKLFFERIKFLFTLPANKSK